MAGYGWDSYDPRYGGTQTIHDAGNGIDITTEFVKFPEHGTNGGSWAVRVKGVPRKDVAQDTKTTLVFYVGLEGLGELAVENAGDEHNAELGFLEAVKLTGSTPDLSDFTISVVNINGEHPFNDHPAYKDKPLDRTFVHSLQIPFDAIWQVKTVLFSSIKAYMDPLIKEYTHENLPPPSQVYTIQNRPGIGNLHLAQTTFQGAFDAMLIYSSNNSTLR